MIGLLNAIKTRLESTGAQVYLVDVPENVSPAYPYFLLWAGGGSDSHLALDGDQAYLVDEPIGVTCVGLTPESALILSKNARAKLKSWTPSASGWEAQQLRLGESRTVLADRDVTLPGSNRHPYYCVDIYDLNAEKV